MVGFKGTFAESTNEKPSSVEVLGVRVEKEKYYRYTPKVKESGTSYPALCWILDLTFNDKREVVIHLVNSDRKKYQLTVADIESIHAVILDDDEGFDDWVVGIIGA